MQKKVTTTGKPEQPQKDYSCEPGSAQGFFLVKENYFCHLFLGPAPGFSNALKHNPDGNKRFLVNVVHTSC